jgi:hypothetical protein
VVSPLFHLMRLSHERDLLLGQKRHTLVLENKINIDWKNRLVVRKKKVTTTFDQDMLHVETLLLMFNMTSSEILQ